MKNLILFLVTYILLLSNTYGQRSYMQNYDRGKFDGYIILKNGDKVEGKLHVKGKIKNQREIKFYERSGEAQLYEPYEIAGYYFNDVKFVSINDNRFTQILEEGCLNIYIYYYINYSWGYSGGLPIIIPYRSRSIQKKFKEEPVSNAYGYSFRKEWSLMLKDNTEIYGKIISRQYRKKHMRPIAKKYNDECEK